MIQFFDPLRFGGFVSVFGGVLCARFVREGFEKKCRNRSGNGKFGDFEFVMRVAMDTTGMDTFFLVVL